MRAIVLAAALAALVAAPALAQDPVPRPGKSSKAQSSDQPGYAWRGYGSGHDAPYRAFGAVNPGEGLNSPTRDPALRECAATSQKYTESTWGTMQMNQWRTCMAARGQPE
jgi:opacity protein-like surface antigen